MRKDSADFLVDVLSKTSQEEDEFIYNAIMEKYGNRKNSTESLVDMLTKPSGVQKDSYSPWEIARSKLNAKKMTDAKRNLLPAAVKQPAKAKAKNLMYTVQNLAKRNPKIAAALGLTAAAGAGYGAYKGMQEEEPTLLERLGIQ